jgi:hypothetical protein
MQNVLNVNTEVLQRVDVANAGWDHSTKNANDKTEQELSSSSRLKYCTLIYRDRIPKHFRSMKFGLAWFAMLIRMALD